MVKLALIAFLALPGMPAAAEGERSLKGVTMPVSINVEGKTLTLNGMGVRTKIVFKVYVAGLYLQQVSDDGMAIAASEQLKLIDLAFLRAVDGADVAKAISDGFANNAGDVLADIQDRIAKFEKLIPNVQKGDSLSFLYRPGSGIEIAYNGKVRGSIEGKDFADALLRVWLGPKPSDKSLKAGLLGR